MKTLRIARDGRGFPRLETLALPFLTQGPTATTADVEAAPEPSTMTSVRHVRAVSVPAGLLEVVNGACSRRLFLLVSGSLEVTVPHMRATLHEGDVLFVDVPERLAAAAELTAAMGCSYLEVQVGAGWLPVGIVPPALDEEPRSDPSALRVVRMASDGERAHLTPFDALFTEWPARPQDVSALTFICLSPSMTSDWHTEEGVTLLVVLAGGFEVEVGGNGGRGR